MIFGIALHVMVFNVIGWHFVVLYEIRLNF
jgi:hypothetical protein